MKIAVTGGAGFIGSNLCLELCNEHEVVVIDDLSTGRMENLRGLNIDFIEGSITDLDLLETAFLEVDYVFHQAAIASVQRSIEDPRAANEVNTGGTLKVLVASRESGVRKVIFASSSAVYGHNPESPKREDMVPQPESPYAVTKIAGEHYCRVFSEIYGLKTVCLRYFNVYGPGQDPGSEYAAAIPKFIKRILEKKPPIIYGDGGQTRDFVFVKDAVRAGILAMEKSVQGVFNVATGRGTSVNEVADNIMKILGAKLDPVYEKPRAGDVRDSLADITMAKEKLDFRPEYPLERGLEETIDWFRNESMKIEEKRGKKRPFSRTN
jgi:UDP-glucose 4-epimerase